MSGLFDALIELLQKLMPPAHPVGEPLAGSTCSWCHICSHPLGICLFWLLAAGLLLLILLVACLWRRRKCPVCGEKNKRRAQFCMECGAPLPEKKKAKPEQNQTAPIQQEGRTFWEERPAPAQQSKETSGAPAPREEEEPVILQPGSKLCPSCGSALPEQAVFCGECGRRLEK